MDTVTIQNIIDLPPRLILELASGLREGVDVAADFGFSADQWESMRQQPLIVQAVEAKKTELKESGWVFRAKCALIADELLADLYLKATAEGSSLPATLDSLRFVAKAAGLDQPKQDAAAAGSGFSISIVIGGQSVQISGAQKGRILEEDDEEEHFDFTQSFGSYEPVALPA